jgi:stearoyl-CoA desaturase (Delta-9 desaturase)
MLPSSNVAASHHSSTDPERRQRALRAVQQWFDTQDLAKTDRSSEAADRIDWARAVPFIVLHLACVAVIWVGVSRAALAVAAGFYGIRMFALTAFYHRYFSHRAFKTSRPVQFIFALLGATCVQRGPLWWAAHHRTHHRHADTSLDPHSPTLTGLLWSHLGWFLTPRAFPVDWERIPDLRKYPELRWLDRYDTAVPIALALALYGSGVLLHHLAPSLGTNGGQMLVWGFFVSTVVLFHATVTINSLAHRFGRRRFDTDDDSRNNLCLALLTFGEGWHNNHHFYPGSVRQGFHWWEVDLTWYLLRGLAALRLVWGLQPVPAWVAHKAKY